MADKSKYKHCLFCGGRLGLETLEGHRQYRCSDRDCSATFSQDQREFLGNPTAGQYAQLLGRLDKIVDVLMDINTNIGHFMHQSVTGFVDPANRADPPIKPRKKYGKSVIPKDKPTDNPTD